MLQPSAPRWLQFYRYIGAAEAHAVETARIVMTLSGTGITWYTPDRYLTRAAAKQFLALPQTPTHRVGPYPEDELPAWAVPLAPVEPAFGEPGGGWQAATQNPLYLFAIEPLADV